MFFQVSEEGGVTSPASTILFAFIRIIAGFPQTRENCSLLSDSLVHFIDISPCSGDINYIYAGLGIFRGTALIERLSYAAVTFAVVMAVMIPLTEFMKKSKLRAWFGVGN